jgi:hypothetical protein
MTEAVSMATGALGGVAVSSAVFWWYKVRKRPDTTKKK